MGSCPASFAVIYFFSFCNLFLFLASNFSEGHITGSGGEEVEDAQIIELYIQRREQAIEETERRYGPYLRRIARNILHDEADSEECVNDAYLRVWNSIPPNRPTLLLSYLAKLTRRSAIDQFRVNNREKRVSSQLCTSLEELEEVLSAGDTVHQALEAQLLASAISAYLRTLPRRNRQIFVSRYYFADSIREIAQRSGVSEANAKVILHRTRTGLRAYLKQEGILL